MLLLQITYAVATR